MMKNDEGKDRTDEKVGDLRKIDPSFKVFTHEKAPWSFSSVMAIFLWMGILHFIFWLFVVALILLPSIWGYTILAILLILVVSPIDEASEFGNRLTEFICHHIKGYFPVTVVVEDIKAFDPNQAYVLALEPHSILPIGIATLCRQMGFLPLPKIKAVATSVIFYTPIVRQIWTWVGLTPATRKNIISRLNSGYSCIVIPGGAREILYMKHGTEVAYLKKRYGFVRVAIETGSPLVPVFSFGQTYAFGYWKPRGSLYSQLCRILRFAPLLFWGSYGQATLEEESITYVKFDFVCDYPLPHRRPLHVVVGKPINVKKNPEPSVEEVVEVHTQFLSAMQELYDKHKESAGYQDIPFSII